MGPQPVPLPTLGIDIGGVIVARGEGLEDTNFFGSRPMDTPPLPGAIDAISVLAGARFAGPGAPGQQGRAEDRGDLPSVAAPVGLPHRDRTDRARGPLRTRAFREGQGVRQLGITHFVDDRLSVLNVMPEVPFRYLFTGGLSAAQKAGRIDVPPGIVAVDDWPSLHRLLTEGRQS